MILNAARKMGKQIVIHFLGNTYSARDESLGIMMLTIDTWSFH